MCAEGLLSWLLLLLVAPCWPLLVSLPAELLEVRMDKQTMPAASGAGADCIMGCAGRCWLAVPAQC
jgi:hypothetical protein